VKKGTAEATERLTWRKKGTGPTTSAGKKRSYGSAHNAHQAGCELNQNAIKHGCRSQTKILPGESAEEYQQVWQKWLGQYIPQTDFDLGLIEMAVNCEWRLRRSEKALDDVEREMLRGSNDGAKWSDKNVKRLQLIQRYRTTAENSFNKAWRAIEFQMERKKIVKRDLEREVKNTVKDMEQPQIAQAKALVAQALTTKSGKVKSKPEETPKTLAQQLFQGQNHAKNKKKIVRLEQWIEVRIVDGKTVTTLYPANKKLIEEGKGMLPPPEYVYRRINFPDGIPAEYEWAGILSEEHRERGGCGLQRMTVDTWLDVIEREKLRKDGHIGPTGVGNLPRPKEHGPCPCPKCVAEQALLEQEEQEREKASTEDLPEVPEKG